MRLRLPARYGGLGLRARSSWLKCAAFLGAVDQALPSFIDPPNPGPLVRAYDTLGAVQPIVFGYLAEASAGACDLIKSVADELAPRYADLYLLESVEAAVGIATDRLREEIGAAVFKAQARVILDRIRYCYRGNRAADARRHLQQARWRSRAAHARSHGRPRGRYSLLHRRP